VDVGVFVFVAGLAAAILAATAFGRVYWDRRVQRWARDHGLRLVEFRGARLWEGPRAWRRSDSQYAFRVVVEDASGRVRTGRLTFGSYFSFWPVGQPEIRWES
jgi:hypothetical protein